jgi:hypothetical protein
MPKIPQGFTLNFTFDNGKIRQLLLKLCLCRQCMRSWLWSPDPRASANAARMIDADPLNFWRWITLVCDLPRQVVYATCTPHTVVEFTSVTIAFVQSLRSKENAARFYASNSSMIRRCSAVGIKTTNAKTSESKC